MVITGLAAPILVLVVVNTAMSVHPRFRLGFPTADYGQPTINRARGAIYTGLQRPADRPVANWGRGNAKGTAALSHGAKPVSGDVTSFDTNGITDDVAKGKGSPRKSLLLIRDLLEKVVKLVKQHTPLKAKE